MVVLALLLRLGAVAWHGVVEPDFFRPDPAEIQLQLASALEERPTPAEPHLSRYGFEVGAVAWNLVCRERGFGSPFGGDTGPTGWVAPVPVAVWASAFAAQGCFSGGAVLWVLAVALTASGLITVLVARAGELLTGSSAAGLLAALAFALSPFDLRLFRASSLIDLNLPDLALVAVLVAALAWAREPGPARLVVFGCAAGVAGLTQPPVWIGACAAFGYLAWRHVAGTGAPGWRRGLAWCGAFLLLQGLLLGPWILHRHAAVGTWGLVKTNAPFELWQGNRPGVGGLLQRQVFERHHPSLDRWELEAYARLGEAEYLEAKLKSFLRTFEPMRFAADSGRRLFFFLFGHLGDDPEEAGPRRWLLHGLYSLPGTVLLLFPWLAARRARGLSGGARPRLPAATVAIYCLLAGYAAPYLVTGVTDRYVEAITPVVLLLLAVMAWWWWYEGGGEGASEVDDRPSAAEESLRWEARPW